MEPTNMTVASPKPSKMRIVLMWMLMLGVILFWAVFWVWRNHTNALAEEGAEHKIISSILDLFIGAFFFGAGAVAYLVAVFTGCLSFSYQKPVWAGAKVRLYFLNIVVTVLLGLGLGFLFGAFARPTLLMMGLDPGVAMMLPLMLMIVAIQAFQLWVLMWSPMERRLIIHRLKALGIQPGQLQNAVLVGLSNPASGFAKRFASIEEDMGAMWVGPDQLIFWGDVEQFSIRRDQIVQIERKADNRSTTMLAGIAHVILHIRLPDGNVRQIRLHVEGLWTMGQKRRVMDQFGEAINQWYAGM